MRIFIIILLVLTVSCSTDEKKPSAGADAKPDDPKAIACTMVGAADSYSITLTPREPAQHYLFKIVGSNSTFLSTCNGVAIHKFEIFNYPGTGQQQRYALLSLPADEAQEIADKTYTVFELSDCSQPATAVLFKENFKMDYAVKDEVVYPNGEKCPSQKIKKGSADIIFN